TGRISSQPATRPTTAPGVKYAAVRAQDSQGGPSAASAPGAIAGKPSAGARKPGSSQSVTAPPTTPKIHQGNASRFNSWPCPCAPSSVLRISTARDGVIVKALTAEMIVETAIVTANCRKN